MVGSARLRVGGAAMLALILSGCSAGEQSSPEAALKAAYGAISDGNFADACEFIDERAKQSLANFGSTCEVAMAKEYPPETRAKMTDVEIDMDGVDTSADVVKIPEKAVSFGGRASDDGDTTLVKRDGKWWITASR
ncbi:hypothetical protein [Humibacillus xanthopallidus]|uniref:hypothetical protein n=1 Tax=Humibacillus xanthopallidus TaxID=412689 RepID=UPI00384D5497